MNQGNAEMATVAYIGDGNNVRNSLMAGCAMRCEFHIASPPKGYNHRPAVLKKHRLTAKKQRREIMVRKTLGPGERCRCAIYRHLGQHGAGSGSGGKAQSFADFRSTKSSWRWPSGNSYHALPPSNHGEEVSGIAGQVRSRWSSTRPKQIDAQKHYWPGYS